MPFASDFGRLVPWWLYVLFAVTAILVVALCIAVAVGVLVGLVRIFTRLLSGDARTLSQGRDSDGE